MIAYHIKCILMIVLPWLLTYTLEVFIFYSAHGGDLQLTIDSDCGFHEAVLSRCLVRSTCISIEKKILLILFWFTALLPLSWPAIKMLGGFPGGAVVENLPANAGDTGSSPGLGRSHVPRSSWAREPQLLSLRIWSLCPATGGAAIVRGPRTAMKSGPRLPQLEKALARTEDPAQPKIDK